MGPAVRIAIVAALLLSGCEASLRTHGYAPLPEAVEDIRVGADTRGSVRRKIGRPTAEGLFGETDWVYVATTVEHYTYHAPRVIDRRVVAITFDANDVVTEVGAYGLEDGRVVDLRTGTTPTYGRQLGIIEQFLGNIGNIGASDLFEE